MSSCRNIFSIANAGAASHQAKGERPYSVRLSPTKETAKLNFENLFLLLRAIELMVESLWFFFR